MADNVTVPGTGQVFASDDIGGVNYPRTKISIGADGAAADVHSGNPLPVTGPLTDAQLRNAAIDTTASTYAAVIASNIITRPTGTTAYATGEIVGVTGGGVTGRFAFPSAARVNGGCFRIDRAVLFKSQATAAGAFSLWIFRGDPAAVAVANAAVAATVLPIANAAAATRLIGIINFDMSGAVTSSLAGSVGAAVAGVPLIGPGMLAQAGAAETALYGVLVATGAYTPASNETFSVILEGYRF